MRPTDDEKFNFSKIVVKVLRGASLSSPDFPTLLAALDCLEVEVRKAAFPSWDDEDLFIQICPQLEEVDKRRLPTRGRIRVLVGDATRHGMMGTFTCPVSWSSHMDESAEIVLDWARKMVSTEEFPILVEHLADRDVPEVKAWTKSLEAIMCQGVEPTSSRDGYVRAL